MTEELTPRASPGGAANEEIARRAYQRWEQEGRPEGCAERHWLEAERAVRDETAGEGNPANPSLPHRERMISESRARDEPVRKIPAESLKPPGR